MRAVFAVALVATLAGCQTMSPTSLEAQAEDETLCKSYGTVPGTNAYAECRILLLQQRQYADAERRSSMMATGAMLMTVK